VTAVRHVLELLAVAGVLAGPVPLGLTIARADVGLSARLLTTLVAWCALQAGLGLGLALAGWLTPGPLLAAELALVALGLAVLPRGDALPRPTPPLEPAEWFIVAALAVLGVTLLLYATAHPIKEHDSLDYHLPALARWVYAGAMVPVERIVPNGRYPYGWELLSALLVVPLREDVFVGVPNLIAWSILGLAVHGLARALGAPRLHAMAAAFLVLALPVTREQVETMHVDLAMAAFVLAGVYFALARDGAMLVIALALAVAVKTSALIYAALVAVVWVLAPRTGLAAPRRPWSLTLPTIIAALSAAGFWYARNLIEIGNPLGLVHVTAASITLFPGPLEPAKLRRTTLAALFDPGEAGHWRIVASVFRNALGVPGGLLIAASLGLPRGTTTSRRGLVVVLALTLACAAAYVVTPFSGDNGGHGWRLTPWMREGVRYALPFLGLLGVLAAAGAARIVGAAGVAAAVLAASVDAVEKTTPAALALVALAAVALFARRRAVATGAALVLGMTVVWGASVVRERRAAERAARDGPVVARLAAELSPGTAVGHFTTASSYALYGPRFSNRVVFVPALSGDRDDWVRTLRARGVAIVAAGPVMPYQRDRPELAWLADPGGPFVRLAGDDPNRETVLYRLR
jgi:hypothetical protein